jgi:hypothetical protein
MMSMRSNSEGAKARMAQRFSVALIAVALLLCACALPPRLYPGMILTTPEGAFELDVLWLRTGQPVPEWNSGRARR